MCTMKQSLLVGATIIAVGVPCIGGETPRKSDAAVSEDRSEIVTRTAIVQLPFTSGEREITYELQGAAPVIDGDVELVLDPVPIAMGSFQSFDTRGRAMGVDVGNGLVSQEFAVSAINGERFRWPRGVVPFVINTNVGQTLRQEIQLAIHEFNSNTNVMLRPRTADRDYVEFVARTSKELRSAAGRSAVGRQGGRQEVGLLQSTDSPAPTETADKGTVLHEIGHAIGLWHEHQRMDRDEHIEILWQNIDARKKKFLFITLADPKGTNFGRKVTDGIDMGPYDPQSIMHYHDTAFGELDASGDELPTLRHKRGLPIGGGDSLTAYDIAGINQLYPEVKDGLDPNSVPFAFHHPSFTEGTALHSSSRHLDELNINDRMTGIRVPAGWEIVLYRHSDFRGENIRFTGPTEIPDLRKVDMKDSRGRVVYQTGFAYGKVTWNDQVSSVEVIGANANRAPIGDSVVLYEHSYWRGRRLETEDWIYTLKNNTHQFNDVVSSIHVPSGRAVELYEHEGCGGWMIRIVGPMDVGNFHSAPDGRNWGDVISSIKILGGPGEIREKERQERANAKRWEEYERHSEERRRRGIPEP